VGAVYLSRGADNMIRNKVLTIYSKWIERVVDAKPGDWVYIRNWRGKIIGQGFYEGIGALGVRIFYYGADEELLDVEYIIESGINRSIRVRRNIIDRWDSYRLVNADGDWLPGLIIDLYDDIAVIQSSSIGIDNILAYIGSYIIKTGLCKKVYLRNDHRGRREAGLPIYRKWLVGEGSPRTIINEEGVLFNVDVENGQKTGFFLDQKLNRIVMRRFTSGRVLDLFSYTGGFGLHMAYGGASEVIMVEESDYAVSEIYHNIKLNKFSEKIQVFHGRVEEYLNRSIKNEDEFDIIICDPPSFIPSKEFYRRGLRAYQNLYSMVFRCIADGGAVVASSCSYFLSKDRFLEILNDAAENAGRNICIMGYYGASPDHLRRPIDNELDYLKVYLLGVG
jgi:23S rRNA (cytosine1962-C5)-methyltransferase